ncbi:helix-turn-helix transcriptional regulator [Shimia sp. R9_2]|nr:helix-turn-helix transcriptional regulator [Shimia sp. R9_2]
MKWDDEPKPTPLELELIEIASRMERTPLTLGINERTRAVLRVLLTSRSHWTASAMAARVGHPRSTVSETLRQLEGHGCISRNEHGYLITEEGSKITIRLERETRNIVFGSQTGYSPELISHFRDGPFSNPSSEASSIEFSKLIY